MSNKRVMLTLDKDLAKVIDKLKGFGDKDAQKCQNLIRAYLSEKGYLKNLTK